MRRINTTHKAADLFGPGKDGFRNGDMGTGIMPTELNAEWFNMMQEEIAGVVEAAGLALNSGNSAQLQEAIKRLIDAQSGNYALDTGAANAYVVALDPAIVAYADGMTVRVKVVNANTGASTLNAGGGAKSLVNDVGTALAVGDIPASSVFTATYILAADKFYITSMVQSQGDARYAKLEGLLTQAFVAADGATGKQVVNISQFAKSLSGSGYQKLPGGFIIQWGGLTNTGGSQAVTFPIAFPAAVASITSNGGWATGGNYLTSVSGLTTTGFTMNSYTSNTGVLVTCNAVWIAIGY